jgi:hypothetical protein
VISMYARVRTQSLALIEQVMVMIFEVVQRWVAGHVWVRVSIRLRAAAHLPAGTSRYMLGSIKLFLDLFQLQLRTTKVNKFIDRFIETGRDFLKVRKPSE